MRCRFGPEAIGPEWHWRPWPGVPSALLPRLPTNRNASGYYRPMAQLTRTVSNAGRSRRRGEVLERALYDATFAELASVGYGGLTMEGIAARAHTGKAALYRRWASKHDLVQAALQHAVPPLPEPRAGRSARENLLAVFTAHRDVLAGKTDFPGLDIVSQLLHEPELRAIFADAVVAPRLTLVESILQAAVKRPSARENSTRRPSPR
jgi:AcrR family transcriptional regulator